MSIKETDMKKLEPGDEMKVNAVTQAAVSSLSNMMECSKISAAYAMFCELLDAFGAFDSEATKRLLRAIASQDEEKATKYRNQIFAAHDAWVEKENNDHVH